MLQRITTDYFGKLSVFGKVLVLAFEWDKIYLINTSHKSRELRRVLLFTQKDIRVVVRWGSIRAQNKQIFEIFSLNIKMQYKIEVTKSTVVIVII